MTFWMRMLIFRNLRVALGAGVLCRSDDNMGNSTLESAKDITAGAAGGVAQVLIGMSSSARI